MSIQCFASPTTVRLIQWMPTGAGRHAARMDHASLESAALAHVDESYYYGTFSGKRKHSAPLSLVKLRSHRGDDLPLMDVGEWLRCRRCRSPHIVVTFRGRHQRSGDLARLFELPVS